MEVGRAERNVLAKAHAGSHSSEVPCVLAA